MLKGEEERTVRSEHVCASAPSTDFRWEAEDHEWPEEEALPADHWSTIPSEKTASFAVPAAEANATLRLPDHLSSATEPQTADDPWARLEQAERDFVQSQDEHEVFEPEELLEEEPEEKTEDLIHEMIFGFSEETELLPDAAELFDSVDREFEIPDFDPDARQRLLPPSNDDPDADEMVPAGAIRKAATIAALVDCEDPREEVAVFNFLKELFAHLTHASTFHAIRRIAEGGIAPYLLYDVVELRRVWLERGDWWMGRYGRSRDVAPLRHGASALSWVQCLRICHARSAYPPELMIDEQWFSNWLVCPPGEPGYLSFVEFIDVELESSDATALDHALFALQCIREPKDFADKHDWYRHDQEYRDLLFYCSVSYSPDRRWKERAPLPIVPNAPPKIRTPKRSQPPGPPSKFFTPEYWRARTDKEQPAAKPGIGDVEISCGFPELQSLNSELRSGAALKAYLFAQESQTTSREGSNDA